MRRTEIEKALQTASAAPAIIPEDLEPALVELLYSLSPLTKMLPVIEANGTTHEIARRSAASYTPWFEGELTETPSGKSTYSRDALPLKILRAGGGVSGFLQAGSKKFLNALEKEQLGAVESMADLFEFGVLLGNASADAYQYSGFDKLITTNRHIKATATVTLGNLDDLIDACIPFRGVDRDPRVLLMSPKMRSKISALQTRVTRQVEKIQYEGGFEMEAYRAIPILPTTVAVSPDSVGTMGTVTAADDATAGGFTESTAYDFKVSYVGLNGESLACAKVDHTTGAGKTSVKLSFTAVAGAKLYKVYAGADGGTLYLSGVFAAQTYDATGALSTPVADVVVTVLPTAGDLPLATTDELIWLINLNQERGVSLVSLLSELGEKVDNLIRYIELATRKSAYEFILESFCALQVPWEKLHGVIRGVKTT